MSDNFLELVFRCPQGLSAMQFSDPLDLFRETVLVSFDPDILEEIRYRCGEPAKSWDLCRLEYLGNFFHAWLPESRKIGPRECLRKLDLSGLILSAEDRYRMVADLKEMTGLTQLSLDADFEEPSSSRLAKFAVGVKEAVLASNVGPYLAKFSAIIKDAVSACRARPSLVPPSLSAKDFLESLLSLPLEELSLKNLSKTQAAVVCKKLKGINPACSRFSLAGSDFSCDNTIARLIAGLAKTNITYLDLSEVSCTDKQAARLVSALQDSKTKLNPEFYQRIRSSSSQLLEIFKGQSAQSPPLCPPSVEGGLQLGVEQTSSVVPSLPANPAASASVRNDGGVSLLLRSKV